MSSRAVYPLASYNGRREERHITPKGQLRQQQEVLSRRERSQLGLRMLLDFMFLLFVSILLASLYLGIYTALVIHFPQPVTVSYCTDICQPSDCVGVFPYTTPCALSYSFGGYLYGTIFNVPGCSCGVLFVYAETFGMKRWRSKNRDHRTMMRRKVAGVFTLTGLSLSLYTVQVFLLSNFHYSTQQTFYFLVMLWVFFDRRLKDFILPFIAKMLPNLTAVAFLEFVFPTTLFTELSISQRKNVFVSFLLPSIFFLLSFITKQCLKQLLAVHGEELSSDSILFSMYVVYQMLQLTASISRGTDTLAVIIASTVSSCAGYILTVVWNLWRLAKVTNEEQSKISGRHQSLNFWTFFWSGLNGRPTGTAERVRARRITTHTSDQLGVFQGTSQEAPLAVSAPASDTRYDFEKAQQEQPKVLGENGGSGKRDPCAASERSAPAGKGREVPRTERGKGRPQAFSPVRPFALLTQGEKSLTRPSLDPSGHSEQRKEEIEPTAMEISVFNSTILWKRMAISMTVAMVSGVGALTSVILYSNFFHSTIITSSPCFQPKASLYTALRVRSQHVLVVLIVVALMTVFISILEVMQLGILKSWQRDRLNIIRTALILLLCYGPYFLSWILYSMIVNKVSGC